MDIPIWEELPISNENLNPLELFVYNHEPAGIGDERRFREDLQRLVDWLVSQGRSELPQCSCEDCCDVE